MFRNRRNSQKPNEEFYAAFKQNFPSLGPVVTTASEAPLLRSTSLSDALTDAHVPHRHFSNLDELKEQDVTPKHLNDTWRFTPSLMDPNSFAFANFANQPPGYYTPTPGGVNTLYHSQAGDLHTPGMGMNIGTPTSLPHTAHPLQTQDPSMADLHHFQPHFLQTHPFQNLNPFGHQQHLQPQQQAFHPSNFLQHQDSGYGAMDHSPHKSPQNLDFLRNQHHTQMVPASAKSTIAPPPFPMGEKFRYHATLNAPTAMIKHSDEIPITYLNKGQAYTLSVIDTSPLASASGLVKYRTFVRISFEDEQQRSKPAACWQLWKEGRGTNEAHQRGGKLLAVEYVDPNQGGDDETRKPQVELESASFDGFCVTWTANPMTGGADCAISVRFNFLSTDFSHSKGVKGIPVRLCAKTEMLLPGTVESTLADEAEVCYCKVKLFRDHGAERKLSNDVAHVKKTIEKLKQQIAQAESGMGGFGRRKRSGSSNKGSLNRPGKVMKHKRTWSADSDGEGNSRPSAEEDLHIKLATMQDMFTSTRPVSVLFLKGDPEDDMDKFPVQLGDSADTITLTRTQTWESKQSPDSASITSNVASPTPSATSLTSINRSDRKQSSISATPLQQAPKQEPIDWAQPQSPVKSAKVSKPTTNTRGIINAVGVDASYVAPPERPIKPVACFFVAERPLGAPSGSTLYRAVYLMQRTVKDLVNGISTKCSVDPTRISSAVRISSKGIRIAIDDDVVSELPEGQDMFVEFHEADKDSSFKQDIFSATSDLLVDGDMLSASLTGEGLEMRLFF